MSNIYYYDLIVIRSLIIIITDRADEGGGEAERAILYDPLDQSMKWAPYEPISAGITLP